MGAKGCAQIWFNRPISHFCHRKYAQQRVPQSGRTAAEKHAHLLVGESRPETPGPSLLLPPDHLPGWIDVGQGPVQGDERESR